MGIWILMLLTALLLPVLMIVFGRIFSKSDPGEINSLFGYRAAMSMKNRDTWEFAHNHFGRLWFRLGLFLLPLSLLVMVPLSGKSTDFIGTVGCVIVCLQAVIMLLPILSTERALKQRFDDLGNKR